MQDLKGRLAGSRRAKGQGLVEFALVIPILFLIAVAVGDFGRVYVSLIAVEDAAREAADYAAFDDPSPSHFTYDALTSTVDATPSVRHEALRRACEAVKALPDYSAVATTCADLTAECSAAAGSFCQLQLENHRSESPWNATCDPGLNPPQPDATTTCGWVVRVTITFNFYTTVDLPPVPNTVNIVRDSRYAISAFPSGT